MSEIFAKRLKDARELRDLTQDKLAIRCNKSRSTMSGYEAAPFKEPEFDLLATICKELRVSADYLLGVSDTPDNSKFVFPNDCVNFQSAYNSMPSELRPVVDPVFDSVYRMLLPDMIKNTPERLSVYSDLFRKMQSLRSQVKALIDKSGGQITSPVDLSELMSLQSELKNTVSAFLDELMQADMEIAFKVKINENAELETGAAV